MKPATTNSAKRRQDILIAAAALFRDKGYGATSMNDIAQVVGIKAASLYNHIQSKQEILVQLLMPIAGKFSEGMAQIYPHPCSPLEKLERLVALHVRLTLENPRPISLITGEWVHLREPEKQQFIRQRVNYEDKFVAIIGDCIREGEFAPVDPQIALFAMLSSLHSLHSWYRRHPGISPEALESSMIHCLIEGLRTKTVDKKTNNH